MRCILHVKHPSGESISKWGLSFRRRVSGVAVLADRAAEPDERIQDAAGETSEEAIEQLAVDGEGGAKIALTVSVIAHARGTFPPPVGIAATVAACWSVRSQGLRDSAQRSCLNCLAASVWPAWRSSFNCGRSPFDTPTGTAA